MAALRAVQRAARVAASRGVAASAAVRGFASAGGDIRTVGVVGLGLMGHGIAQVAAERGFDVVAVEHSQGALDHGVGMIQGSLGVTAKRAVKKGKMDEAAAAAWTAEVMDRVTTSVDKGALADVDLVVEAIIEDVGIKTRLYDELEGIVKPEAIFATNTSSLQLSDIPVARGDKWCGLHFFNPVQMMPLLEVVRASGTSDATFDAVMAWGTAMGKSVVACKDTPGFLVNRLLVPYMAQAIALIQRGDGTVADTDAAMKLGAGVPMGPLHLADYVGLDTCLSILRGWVEKYPDEPAFFVPELLVEMVEAGHTGRKSGQGFYKWEGGKPVVA